VEERNRVLRRWVNRRDFLTLASSGAAVAIGGLPQIQGQREAASPRTAGGVKPLDTGGIATEHFENARRRAAAIVAKMSLPEKISQFGANAPALPRVGLPAFNYYASEALHGLIHYGPVTSFPLPLALGCSWNRPLMARVFTAVSDEIWAWHKKSGQGLAMFSPPTVNMGARDPRWGRIAENYGEDPCLVGQMAAYTIHGMQGNDPRYLKTIACAKHYIANDTETGRESTSATVDPRSFWEYYTRGFEACVRDGKVFTVMSSYNALNGIPTTASHFLLTDVLRERWGFRGYVVSDCDAVGDIYWTHHFAPTPAQAAAMAVNAGCDINCGRTLQQNLGKAVHEKLISESVLDHSLIRSFTGRVLLGEFDRPRQIPYSNIPVSCLESPAHRELAREAARQSIVLFKNDNNTLPLDRSRIKKVALIGPMADVCHLGNYSGAPQFLISPLEGISAYLGIPNGVSYRKRASEFLRHSRGPQLEPCGEGGKDLGYITNGSWAAYRGVLFSGATQFHARVASNTAGGTVDVHLDSRRGPLVARLNVSNTDGWQKWVNVAAAIKPVSGEHTVFLRFGGGPGSLFNIQSFYLTPSSFVAAPVRGTEVAYTIGCTVTGPKDPADFAEAVRAAREADVALVFVGVDQQVDREAHDRSYIHLPGVQHELVQAVYAGNPRTVLIISSNAPVAVNWEQDHLPAIVGGLFLGEQQGYALADVLFGDYNPGGKVSTTWYRSVKDLPNFYDYNIRHGRTYMYFHGTPLYPFGHGLSYTTFRYANLRTSGETLKPGGKIICSADVTNSGSRDGDEIIQFYVHCSGGVAARPIKQLVNFDRIHIKAGETGTVSFELTYEDPALQYWDEAKGEFVVEPGVVDIMIGASSADIRLKGRIQLSA
jgi:beta-glucosidase